MKTTEKKERKQEKQTETILRNNKIANDFLQNLKTVKRIYYEKKENIKEKDLLISLENELKKI